MGEAQKFARGYWTSAALPTAQASGRPAHLTARSSWKKAGGDSRRYTPLRFGRRLIRVAGVEIHSRLSEHPTHKRPGLQKKASSKRRFARCPRRFQHNVIRNANLCISVHCREPAIDVADVLNSHSADVDKVG